MRRFIIWVTASMTLITFLSPSSVGFAQGGGWTKKADMPTPREALSTCVVDGKIYAIGGWLLGGWGLSSVEEYDPVTDTWKKKADMPTARGSLSTCVVNGKIYAIGGIHRNNSFSTVEEYDPATDTWRKRADMPTPRGGLSTAVVNGKIYAIGGWGGWAKDVTFSTVEEYDPTKNRWERKSDLLTARKYMATGTVNGKIYVLGGIFGRWQVLSSIEAYNPMTNRWDEAGKMEYHIWPATVTLNGEIYAIGGEGVIVSYNPAIRKWTMKSRTPMPTKRAVFAMSAVNEEFYVIGGAGPLPLSTVEAYDLSFVPRHVEARGKLATKWAALKTEK